MVSERSVKGLNGVSALLGGPGGLAQEHLLELERCDLPRVVDSGALASPCGRLHYNAQTVITPHAGEFARAFPEIVSSSQCRERQALDAAAHSGAVLVYKGPVTFIVAPDGRLVRNDRPNPHLAVAGSGDVLAGLIVGLLAQGMDPFWAACAGVWLHSECGERAGRGLIAGDLILALPDVIRAL
jgi:NAD(P)H-hydrate epimerase